MKKASRKGNVKMQSDKMARRWLAGGFAAAVAMAACTCLADAGMSKIDILPGEFWWGGEVLEAPVVEKGAVSRKVALPPGRWKADDGQVYDGPATVEVATPLERLPHFEEVRQ